ncbi:MAG: hypothetical protein EPN41_14510 [Candidimonas sp.]|nr:MAG: hypothetical protein EPN41_14510 [Candidimonas sp.]
MNRVSAIVFAAGLLGGPALLVSPPAAAEVSVGVSVGIAPPPLPVYTQPPVPGPGYIWTPGYWAWSPAGYYYWVPGVWVLPPVVGVLWTPGWWGWSAGFYRWYPGYWGPRVGFYGGIDYGFGYSGRGYDGGYWRGRDFYYNRTVNNVNVTNIRNVYVGKTVVNNVRNRVSFNGGRGGTVARPTSAQRRYEGQHHYAPTSFQTRQREMSERDRGQRFDANRGRPEAPARQYLAHPEERQSGAGGRQPEGRQQSRPGTGGPQQAPRAGGPVPQSRVAPPGNHPNAGRPDRRASEPVRREGMQRPPERMQRPPERMQRSPERMQRSPERVQRPPERRAGPGPGRPPAVERPRSAPQARPSQERQRGGGRGEQRKDDRQ